MAGLLEIFHRVDKSQGWGWTFGNLSDSILPNIDGVHLADRYRSAFWNRLRRHDYYADAGRIFGRIPLKRLGSGLAYSKVADVFHFVMCQEDMEDWQSRRAVEAVFRFHPNAAVYVHIEDAVPGLGNPFNIFAETGYNIRFLAFKPVKTTMNINSFAVDRSLLGKFSVQVAILLLSHGGIYLSSRTFIRRPIPSDVAPGFSLGSDGSLAMFVSNRGSTHNLEALLSGDNELRSGSYRHYSINATPWDMTVLNTHDTLKCARDTNWTIEDLNVSAVSVDVTVLRANPIVLDTECYRLVEKSCIYCDEIYWQYD